MAGSEGTTIGSLMSIGLTGAARHPLGLLSGRPRQRSASLWHQSVSVDFSNSKSASGEQGSDRNCWPSAACESVEAPDIPPQRRDNRGLPVAHCSDQRTCRKCRWSCTRLARPTAVESVPSGWLLSGRAGSVVNFVNMETSRIHNKENFKNFFQCNFLGRLRLLFLRPFLGRCVGCLSY
jgi:hypothetical protein